ncbi:MAG: excinuclease ABC subunit UvrC [Gammaproteobacteria bacterium]|nr:excinuclease ABC subunit UvrC [Gammaproteobacteria bacterium]
MPRSRSASQFDHKAFLATLSSRPGVYRMLDENGQVLYVGKAKNLKNRVGSYFRASGLTEKTIAMITKVADIDVTITSNETEALLLEQSLIKSHKPAYNIQLRDDKSYPYILLTENKDYPRLAFYRGSRKRKGTLFGPYPSAHATRDTLQILQKVFRVRQCEDSYFKNRSRPCLQYQINRCTAPCVGLISATDYAEDVHYSALFLRGKSDALTRELTANMEQASEQQEFEKAARIRDQVIDLRRIQDQQHVANQGADADILAAATKGPYNCVHVIYARAGRIIGSKNFYPKFKLLDSESQLLSAFIGQYYLRNAEAGKSANIPGELILSHDPEDAQELAKALTYCAAHKVKLSHRVRGHRARWLELASTNANEALSSFVSNRQNQQQRFQLLQDTLKLAEAPQRIECFDISHTSGESTVASCVVFDVNGPVKSDYRRFNIKDITPGDDYAAMQQALERRFARLARGEEGGMEKVPDILLIDGGKGQLTQALSVLEQYQVQGILLLGIAKGISRRAGQETLFLADSGGNFTEIAMVTDSAALRLLQQVRDEAHRFAITGHRARREKSRRKSTLEQIPGLGPKRRRDLLIYFGGRQEIKRASEADLARVNGISNKLAETIYSHLHSD